MAMIEDWPSQAACKDSDPDALFVRGAEQNVAKRVCRGCPVRHECLADALDNRVEFGVWGGMTERERRALLRRHPDVVSWRRVFEAALDATEMQAAVQDTATGPESGDTAMDSTTAGPEQAEHALQPEQQPSVQPASLGKVAMRETS